MKFIYILINFLYLIWVILLLYHGVHKIIIIVVGVIKRDGKTTQKAGGQQLGYHCLVLEIENLKYFNFVSASLEESKQSRTLPLVHSLHKPLGRKWLKKKKRKINCS